MDTSATTRHHGRAMRHCTATSEHIPPKMLPRLCAQPDSTRAWTCAVAWLALWRSRRLPMFRLRTLPPPCSASTARPSSQASGRATMPSGPHCQGARSGAGAPPDEDDAGRELAGEGAARKAGAAPCAAGPLALPLLLAWACVAMASAADSVGCSARPPRPPLIRSRYAGEKMPVTIEPVSMASSPQGTLSFSIEASAVTTTSASVVAPRSRSCFQCGEHGGKGRAFRGTMEPPPRTCISGAGTSVSSTMLLATSQQRCPGFAPLPAAGLAKLMKVVKTTLEAIPPHALAMPMAAPRSSGKFRTSAEKVAAEMQAAPKVAAAASIAKVSEGGQAVEPFHAMAPKMNHVPALSTQPRTRHNVTPTKSTRRPHEQLTKLTATCAILRMAIWSCVRPKPSWKVTE
mmetsp:Transcript_129560/g.360987  ORF Transcript_129560/g.360987 Transcript_129560/m.360987 type:complete len:402 (-) Transcript_129560:171-1376(-)